MNNIFNQNENLTLTLNKIQKELNNEIESKKNLEKEIIHREEIIKNLTNQITEFSSFKNLYENSEKELVTLKGEINEIKWNPRISKKEEGNLKYIWIPKNIFIQRFRSIRLVKRKTILIKKPEKYNRFQLLPNF